MPDALHPKIIGESQALSAAFGAHFNQFNPSPAMPTICSHSLKKTTFCAAALLATFFSPESSAATIVANFAGGASDEVADGWAGKAGFGWADAWKWSNGGSHTFGRTLTSDQPLIPGGGNYLEMKLTHSGTGTWASMSTFRRYQSYEDIALTEAHTVTFEYRLDHALDSGTRFLIFDAQSGSREINTDGINTTWAIRYDTGGIAIYNRTSPVIQNYFLTQGDAYRFTIHISPSTNISESSYRVGIENLTTPGTPFLSDEMAFYTPQSAVGGFLNFSTRVGNGFETQFSIDSIQVAANIPEPASTALIGGILLGIGVTRGRLFFRNR